MWLLGSRQVRYAAVGLMGVVGVMVSVMVGDILWTDTERSSDEIRKVMIADSVSSYDGNCPCPYASDASGRRCGRRSAYIRAGGDSLLCFPTDISEDAVSQYRSTPVSRWVRSWWR